MMCSTFTALLVVLSIATQTNAEECSTPYEKDVNHGKRCPGNQALSGCLNHNKGYTSYANAWKACGKVKGCGFIMKWSNGKFYLRRLSDPDHAAKGLSGYTYKPCPPAQQCVNHGKRCPGNQALSGCLNHNKGYTSYTNAWKACGKVKGCGFIMRWSNGKFYLRRLSDPDHAGKGIWGYDYKQCPRPLIG